MNQLQQKVNLCTSSSACRRPSSVLCIWGRKYRNIQRRALTHFLLQQKTNIWISFLRCFHSKLFYLDEVRVQNLTRESQNSLRKKRFLITQNNQQQLKIIQFFCLIDSVFIHSFFKSKIKYIHSCIKTLILRGQKCMFEMNVQKKQREIWDETRNLTLANLWNFK